MCKQPCQTLASSSSVGGVKLKILPAAFLFGFMSWPSGHCSQPEPQAVLTDGDWFYVVENDGATITGSTATGRVKIPRRLGRYMTKKVGLGAFSNSADELISVSIPNSVTSIGDSAFSGCTELTSVSIPDSVTSIGEFAFGACAGLRRITLPNGVTSIGESTFNSCTELTNVVIPDSVTSIGDAAFANCTALTSVSIPDSVTSIGDMAFQSCTGLTSVSIPNSVTSIGAGAFFVCPNLKEVSIPLRFLSALAQIFDSEVASRLMIQLQEEVNPP